MAAWSGIRPLVTDPNSKDTQSICRNHIVSISDSGLVTIAGQLASRISSGVQTCVLNMLQCIFSVSRWEVDHLQVHG